MTEARIGIQENGKSVLIDGRTSFGAVAEYTCDADYLIRPPAAAADAASATRKCESNGRWSRNEIACHIIECPVPRAPAGTVFSLSPNGKVCG